MKRLGLVLYSLLFLLTACVQSPGNSRRVLLNNIIGAPKAPANTPVFPQGLNYFQNGGQIFSSTMPLNLDFKDVIYLRGKEIDAYIRANGTQTSNCLVVNFSFTNTSKALVVSAMPQSIFNFTDQSIEYFYSISFSDNLVNQNFCNKPGLNTTLGANVSLAIIYDMKSLCSLGNICNSNYSSQYFDIYSANGTILPQLNLKNLSLNLSAPMVSNTPGGTTCVVNSQCSSLGFDCCSNGQCVKDLSVKSEVVQTPPAADFKQALQDILNNPSHIYLYPNFYNICSSPVNQPTIPGNPTPPTNAALAYLKKMENLYNCTNKISGEAGICSKTFPNAVTNTPYIVGIDDQSFQSTYDNLIPAKDTLVSVTEVSYGDIPLYNFANKSETDLSSFLYTDLATATTPAYLSIAGNHNNDLVTGAQVTLLTIPAVGATSQDLVVKYLIDASCTEINPTLVKCEKYFIQGQTNAGNTLLQNRLGRVTDHYPASNFFKLPNYANTNQAFTVEVEGVVLQQNIDWQLNIGFPSTIQLLTTNGSLKALISQKVKISYYVDQTVYNVMGSKKAALNEIKVMCSCPDLRCSLAPILNAQNAVSSYGCVYPDPPAIPVPFSQLVYLSSKTMPIRYFDTLGASQTIITGNTPPQEGKAFSYINNDLSVPNNMPSASITDPYVGFNEIYGSLTYAPNSAKPAKEVALNAGKSYDIYVDGGAYSACTLCGNDYYSQLNKLFPFAQLAGGLIPNRSQTNSSTLGLRADDFSFGRACLVPATMIPWTHAISSVTSDQRQNRMRSQHFLYANGYQHDWYGFDYGAVIGSFDGVKWFAIGTNRRIKATTNKLFLAINGVAGDLTIDNTYNVTINDSSLNPVGANMVTKDFDSDGAQCQRFHQCSTDNDCATSLGWDYTCSPINEATSPWPVFDVNGSEIPDTQVADKRLVNILGINTGGKRCVYRGRGAACTPNTGTLATLVGAFNESITESFHVCSNNNFCQSLSTPNSFNNRLSRFGKITANPLIDSVGFGARTPLRPLDYQGQETIRIEAQKNLNANRVTAICKPGHDPEAFNTIPNKAVPPITKIYDGDKILGMGMSFKNTPIATSIDYLSSCSVFDDFKNYYYSNLAGASPNLKINAGSQVVSTNALEAFNNIFITKQMTFNLFTAATSIITAPTFQANRCLRAPGASCFQDQECAPSKMIADKIKLIAPADLTGSTINLAELKFWQEDLVCSQPLAKTDPLYDPINNVCCREVGKTISIASSTSTTTLAQKQVAGIDFAMNSTARYSRIATAYKDMNLNAASYPGLDIAVNDSCATISATCKNTSALINQFNTFGKMAEKTSCSGNWVRNFASGVNNHRWDKTNLQNIDASTFRCMNWMPNTTNNSCSGLAAGSQSCLSVSTAPDQAKAKGVFDFYGRLELTGIPQIAIPAQATYMTATEGVMSCLSDPLTPSNMTYPGGIYKTPANIWAAGAVAEYTDNISLFLSASDSTTNPNFQSPAIKQIFKSDEVVACLPAGTKVLATADPSLCCTGFIDGVRLKCALPDFVDVSVYTNRYVSSAASTLASNLIEPDTGYIKDTAILNNLACQQQICASGTLASGVLVSKMVITGQENLNSAANKSYRFLEGQPLSDDAGGQLTLYKQGLKINTHLYCFPKASIAAATTAGFTVFSCGY
jgi:hypothetical protein